MVTQAFLGVIGNPDNDFVDIAIRRRPPLEGDNPDHTLAQQIQLAGCQRTSSVCRRCRLEDLLQSLQILLIQLALQPPLIQRDLHARAHTALEQLLYRAAGFMLRLKVCGVGTQNALQKRLILLANVQCASQPDKALERHGQRHPARVDQMCLAQQPRLGFMLFEIVQRCRKKALTR
ncbi:hypothetical protein D3C80_1075170 [compost metagenome]